MLGKILLLALVVWLVLLLLRQYRRSIDNPQKKSARLEPEDMVSCDVCGVHLPRSESILKHGAYYCCKEHSDQAAQ